MIAISLGLVKFGCEFSILDDGSRTVHLYLGIITLWYLNDVAYQKNRTLFRMDNDLLTTELSIKKQELFKKLEEEWKTRKQDYVLSVESSFQKYADEISALKTERYKLINTIETLRTLDKNPKWIPFYFESNACWGMVNNSEEWNNMKELFPSSRSMYDAKIKPVTNHDYGFLSFGFYPEYSGETTLKDFFIEHNMRMD